VGGVIAAAGWLDGGRKAGMTIPGAAAPFLVTLGETMAVFIREPDVPGNRYRLTAAGAETNVAIGAAQLGAPSRWLSRLGDDELGRFVHDFVAGRGVDAQVGWDDRLPTASCVKEVRPLQSRMRYYRSTSAARRLDKVDLSAIIDASHLHLTGVTPALSPENRAVVEGLLRRRVGVQRTSFDVNYRQQLWPDPHAAADVLVPLARLADVVFLGDDEASALLGSDEPADVAARLIVRPGQEVVLKRGAGDATSLVASPARPGVSVVEVAEPAHRVHVVDLTGAGDAFAAGYLVARGWGWSARGRLRLGHLLASRVVQVADDVAPPLDDHELAELAGQTGDVLPDRMGGVRR
jgi:2-dehydro-3-deoxygluconokinase